MSDSSWSERLSGAERVRMVAETVSEPRTANWVAEEADVAHETARKYLDRLVEDGRIVAEDEGDRTVYRPDPVGQYLTETRELYEEHTPEELADSLAEMNEEIRSWRESYGVETPNELRASIAEASDSDDERERKRVASEWERLRYRRQLVEDALRLHDRFPDGRTHAAA
jgi:predicted ArsR family transcriptional regulator